jgi:GTP cyclohydrolase I
VVGIPKLARLVDASARRMQVQEKMTAQIAYTLTSMLKPSRAAVVMEDEHQCMSTRSVHKPSVSIVTSTMPGGIPEDLRTREEFTDTVGSPTGSLP